MRHQIIALLPVFGLAAPAGLAHHSRANFQLDNLVEMRGTVTEFRWANPHIYWEMEMENGETWLIEGHSIPGVTRMGWDRDTLQVGEELLIVAYPDQNTDRKFALIEYLVKADGTPLAGFNPNAIPAELRADAGVPPGMGRGRVAGPVEPSADFSGNWRADMRGVNLRAGAFFDPNEGLPLTAAGEAVMAAYDEAENPWYACESGGGLPFGGGPYGTRIDRHEDRLTITGELRSFGEAYTLWLDDSAAPADQPRSPAGLAIGRVEGEAIVFEVTNFAAIKWGLGRGVDSSDQKHVSGRMELSPDGFAINYTYITTDPVYLTEPLTRSGVLNKEPDREFVNEPCDPEISSLHLEAE